MKTVVVDRAKALARWVKADRDVKFPAGTYWARLYLGAPCLESG